jgi:hypothetical protein
MVIAQQVQGKTAQHAEEEVDIVVTVLILHLIPHTQTVQVVGAVEDKEKQEQVGLHLVPQFYIHQRKFEL